MLGQVVVDVRILGSFEVWSNGTRVHVGGPCQEKLLATLALDAGRSVPGEQLTRAMWDDHPPSTSKQQLHKRIHALRRVLAGTDELIVTDGQGYRLNVPADRVDAYRFDEQVDTARMLKDGGRNAEAITALRAALRLWRGPALAAIGSGLLEAHAARLDECRVTVLEECLGLEITAGRHADVIAELTALVAQHPFRERLVEWLMLALYRSDRQADALDTYLRLRTRMASELGMEPSTRLRKRYESMLRQERVTADNEAPAPACLPMDMPSFTGRAGQLAELDRLADNATTVVISSITGTGGVGKTALAVHWAHRSRQRFPDGQLYINLRGFDRTAPMTPAEAITALLGALGTPATKIPQDLDAQSTLFRSTVDGKRMLIVLDNAATAEQVRPLLPGSPGCFVVVTSRNTLTELVALHDACRVPLDVLPADEAITLLGRILGVHRVAAESQAADELARLTGYLPLALRIAAANLAGRPAWSIADFVRTLASGDRLTHLGVDGDPRASVRAAFDLSFAEVSPVAQLLLPRLGAAPGRDIDLDAASALLGEPAQEALAVLEDAHLVEHYLPGRYRMHDLIKLYARSLAGEDAASAVARLVEFYLESADAAGKLVSPSLTREPRPSRPLFTDASKALSWLRTEYPNLVASVTWAHEHEHDALCAHLVDALRTFFWSERRMQEWSTTGETGLAAAIRLGDLRLEAAMHRNLGMAYFPMGRPDDSLRHDRRALKLAEQLDDLPGMITMHINIGLGHKTSGRLDEADEHLRTGLTLNSAHGDPEAEALSLLGLARTHIFRGRLRQAAGYAGRAAALGAGQALDAAALVVQGFALREMGDLEAASRNFAAAAPVRSGLGSTSEVLIDLTHVGRNHLEAGEPAQALACFEHGREPVGELGDHTLRAYVLAGLAAAQRRLGRQEEALTTALGALRAARTTRNVFAEMDCLNELALAELALGAVDSAAEHAAESISLCERHGGGLHLGNAHQAAARISLARRDRQTALAQASRALAVHRENEQRLRQAEDERLMRDSRGE